MLKIIGIILVFVILQSYFTTPERFGAIIENWKNYFMTVIMSIFIAILLEPIVKYLKKKSKMKMNDVLAISLSITFIILIFIILSLIVTKFNLYSNILLFKFDPKIKPPN